jgi:DNA-binding GntR family transcriptional regulator
VKPDATTTWSGSPMNRVAAPLREQVSNVIRRAILDFELQPGQRLVERELIDRLHVSRATIRESLRELEAEGMVVVIPQRGAVVAKLSATEQADLYEARVAIESLVVRHFVERAADPLVTRLAAAVADLRRLTEAGRPIRDLLAAKAAMYRVLVEGSDSPVLTNILASLQARVSVLRATSLSQPGRPTQAVAELEAMTRAIAARDADEATRWCAEHVQNAAKTGMAALERAEAEH